MRKPGRSPSWLPLLLVVGMFSCTGAGLQPTDPEPPDTFDNLLDIYGEFCTQPDSEVIFPLKVLFLIDQSYSLQCTDSTNKRFGPLTDLVNELLANPAAEIGFIGFSSWSLAQPFTRNLPDIQPFLDDSMGMGPATDYQGALALAIKMLEDDMVESGPAERARTRYIVVFVSDGVPEPRCNAGCEDDQNACSDGQDNDGDGATDGADSDCANIGDNSLHPDNLYGVCNTDLEIPEDEYVDMLGVCPEYNQPQQIMARVSQLLELQDAYSTGSVTLNTVLLFSPQAVVESVCPGASAQFGYDEIQARQMLRGMAEEGNGIFRDANLAIDSSFLEFDMRTLDAPQALANLSAINQHARLPEDASEPVPDSDRDGLPDELELEIGTDPDNPDSDLGGGDGYSDAFEYRMKEWGFDPLDQTIPAVPCTNDLDLDGDGLVGCEEDYLGTDPRHHDTDGDGVTDWFEFILGTEPARDDGFEDLDFDGVLNADEAIAGTAPNVPDADRYRNSAIKYRVSDLGRKELVEGDGEPRECYQYEIRDIELVVTPLVPDRGLNRILVYGMEQPALLASARSTATVACFEVFYRSEFSKDPESGVIDVTQDAWYQQLADLQAAVDSLGQADPVDGFQCDWFDPDPLNNSRADIDDVIDRCLPDPVQLGRFAYTDAEVSQFLAKYVASNNGINQPIQASQMFVPLETFDPDRDCYRPWEFERLHQLFQLIKDTCRCNASGDGDAGTVSPCCP